MKSIIESWMNRFVALGKIDQAEADRAIAWCKADPDNWVSFGLARGPRISTGELEPFPFTLELGTGHKKGSGRK
jgi:hypothetical protein